MQGHRVKAGHPQMNIVTLSNLHPRPDRPQLGMFNARLFDAMARLLDPDVAISRRLENICLVPEWRLWRWPAMRVWQNPHDAVYVTTYCPVFYLPFMGRSLAPLTYRFSMSSLRRLGDRADCIYSSWLYPDGVVAAALARRHSLSGWAMVLGSDTFHLRHAGRGRQIRRAADVLEGLICVGRHLADMLEQVGVPPEKIHVVPNGVDTAHFVYRPQAQAKRSLGRHGATMFALEDASPLILFVGNLVSIKDPETCLKAFAALVKTCGSREKPRLVVLGDGPLLPALSSLGRICGIEDQVIFAGSRHHDDIPLWMAAADALVLTSRSEGMPNVIREALACGLPVIATDVGACREMLEDEPSCRLVSPGDADAVAGAVRRVLKERVDRESLATRHRRHTWEDQARQILDLMGAGRMGSFRA